MRKNRIDVSFGILYLVVLQFMSAYLGILKIIVFNFTK